MLAYVHQFLQALVFTAVVEAVVVLLLSVILKKGTHATLRTIWTSFVGNALTVPYVWFVFPTIFWYSSTLSLYLAEGFAFVMEALIYKFVAKLSWRQAIVFSFIANATSYFLGKLVFGA